MAIAGKRPPIGKTQFERFVDAARQLGTDDDKDRFEARLRKVAKVKAKEIREDSALGCKAKPRK